MNSRIRVVVVEDHPVVRFGVCALIDRQSDMEIVGQTRSAAQMLGIIATFDPDIVVLPFRLEGQFVGVEMCRAAKAGTHPPRVLVYSSFDSGNQVASLFLAGADSFVSKEEEPTRFLHSIRATCAGQRIWLGSTYTAVRTWDGNEGVGTSSLTPRESEVLGCMLMRYTNAQIANEMHIELSTVKTHVRNILQKLGLRRRLDLFKSPVP